MGEMLTVNFRQPSHEFTLGVGTNLISKLTILTLMICHARTRMWFLEFFCLHRILTLKGRLPGKVHQAHCEKIMRSGTTQDTK
jgi:hypothetical protein